LAGGACTGTSNCILTMNSAKSVNANFDIGGSINLAPTVVISSPSNNAVFTTSTITVSGTATDDTSLNKVEVKVNNILQKTVTISGTSASWSTTVTLNSGSNTIQAQSFDSVKI